MKKKIKEKDLPDIKEFQEKLINVDFGQLKEYNEELFTALDNVIKY